MNPPLMHIQHLSVQLGAARVIDDISFVLAAQQTFVLLGESGSGKSMTALAIMRLLPAGAQYASGHINYKGRDMLTLPESTLRSMRGGEIGMIFQEPMTSLNPVLTIGQQIQETIHRHRGLHGAAQRNEAMVLLQSVGIADAQRRLSDYPFQLSGGMKQRVMIAMTLAGNPRLLIADEPTTALDVTIQAQVLDLLRQLQRTRNMGMLLITHDLGVAATMADQIGVMYAGELIEIAPRAAFFAHPAHPYSQKLFAALPEQQQRLQPIPGNVPSLDQVQIGCRFAPRCNLAFARCFTTAPAWTTVDTDHTARCHLLSSNSVISHPVSRTLVHTTPVQHGAELLVTHDLNVYFALRGGLWPHPRLWLKAVDGINLTIRQGETLALVGESGCGKTTLGRTIARMQPITGGRMLFQGEDLAQLSKSERNARRAQVQMVFQDPYASLNPRLRIEQLIEEGMVALNVEADMQQRRQRLQQLMQQVGLPDTALQRYPHEFSGGQRQRIAIARALAVRPQLLVCDEPTSALDVSVQAQIVNLLQDIQQQQGLSQLFITHNLALAGHLAQRIAVMYLGRVVEIGSSTDVLQHPLHPYTLALLSAVPSIHHPPNPALVGETASAVHPPSGCYFHPRCPRAQPLCAQHYPSVTQMDHDRLVNCHFPI